MCGRPPSHAWNGAVCLAPWCAHVAGGSVRGGWRAEPPFGPSGRKESAARPPPSHSTHTHHTHNPLVQAGRTVVRVDKVGFEVGENDKTIHRGTQQRGLAREGQRPQGHGPGHEGGWESGCVDVCPCGEGGKEKRACAPR